MKLKSPLHFFFKYFKSNLARQGFFYDCIKGMRQLSHKLKWYYICGFPCSQRVKKMLAMANVLHAPHVQLRQTQRQETHEVGIRVCRKVNYHVYLDFNYNRLCWAAAQMRQNVMRRHMCLLERTVIPSICGILKMQALCLVINRTLLPQLWQWVSKSTLEGEATKHKGTFWASLVLQARHPDRWLLYWLLLNIFPWLCFPKEIYIWMHWSLTPHIQYTPMADHTLWWQHSYKLCHTCKEFERVI